MERRRFLKHCFLNLPGKPWVYFFYSYVLRGGFLDGRPGFIYNVLKAFYWYQIGIKGYEMRLRQRSEVQGPRLQGTSKLKAEREGL